MEAIKEMLKSEKPKKWLFYGDSITHGVVHTFGQRDYPELFEERIRCELGRTMDVVINTAISGDTTTGLLESFDWRVAQFKPDCVFVMIGMNDCSSVRENITRDVFEQNLLNLKEKIDAIGSKLVLQTTCPIIPNTAPDREPYFDDFMDTIRKVAEQTHTPLIDHERHWKLNDDKHFYWMSNAFHPNGYGHMVFAMLLFTELGIYDENAHCCRFYRP
jgi:lysophospholipase L1-like esterase